MLPKSTQGFELLKSLLAAKGSSYLYEFFILQSQ